VGGGVDTFKGGNDNPGGQYPQLPMNNNYVSGTIEEHGHLVDIHAEGTGTGEILSEEFEQEYRGIVEPQGQWCHRWRMCR